jgi:hypothetical protein
VPSFGYQSDFVRLLESLRVNRRESLPHCTSVVAISEFIAREQSRPDGQDKVPVQTILLGADHMIGRLGSTEVGDSRDGEPHSPALAMVERLRARGTRLVLVLGRWEPACYKNAEATFELKDRLRECGTDVALLILAEARIYELHRMTFDPSAEGIYPLGLPSDADLHAITASVDAAVSLSLWEGFNLPLAEMQVLEKPVYAFDLAAHPEVAVSRQQLCANTEEMAFKLLGQLQAGGQPNWAASATLAPWRQKFTWQRFMDDFTRLTEAAA